MLIFIYTIAIPAFLVSLIYTAALGKRWQRFIALTITLVLAVPVFMILCGEVKVAIWAADERHICRPVQSIFDDLLAEVRSNDCSRATAHLTFVATNWHQVMPHPWMKNGEWLIQEWKKESEPTAPANGASPRR